MEQNSFLPSLEKNDYPIKIESRTVASERHIDRNEDALLVDYKNNIFGVFDGMGGHASGDKASKMAKDCVSYGLNEMPKDISVEEKMDYFSDVLTETNKLITEKARLDGTDMGTTAVIGVIHENMSGEKQAIIASVGDSRAYLYRDGNLKQITIDDDRVRFELKRNPEKIREIQKKLSGATNPELDLNEYELSLFKNRNQISAGLGVPQNFMIQTYILDIKFGDRLMFCSDGISDNLTENKIAEIMGNKKNTVNNLIDEAINISRDVSNPRHKIDDISAIIVDIDGTRQDKEINKSQIQLGDRVNVVRSNGKIDSRYKVAHINNEGKATVMFMADEENSSIRHISIDSLEKINITPNSIEDAKNIPDLYRYLKSVGSVKGKDRSYSSVDLINIINGVENGQYIPETITRTDGLRNKVKELLKIN